MSKKTAVIYQSKYGSTKRYAQWIAQALGADLYESKKVDIDKLSQYDRLILGGGLYAVTIGGVKKLTKNLDKLGDKDIIFFSVGLSTVTDKVVQEIKNRNFSEELKSNVKLFALRGSFDFQRLNWMDKQMMKMMRKMLLKKGDALTEDEKNMLASYDVPVDFVEEKNIEPIIRYCNGE